MTQFVRSSDGTRLAIESAGAGPAVVLVDGALGSRSSDATVATAGLLAPRFSVYRYDRRGCGESDDAPRGLEGEIVDLAAVLAKAGGPAFVFGTSSGGNLALHAAAARLPIRKLALWEPNFVVSESRPPLPPTTSSIWTSSSAPTAAARRWSTYDRACRPSRRVRCADARDADVARAPSRRAHARLRRGDRCGTDGRNTATQAEWQAVTVSTVVLDGGTTLWLSEGADALAQRCQTRCARPLPASSTTSTPPLLHRR
jgi:pimeloyl-ACP methyl ester carboxylesterase